MELAFFYFFEPVDSLRIFVNFTHRYAHLFGMLPDFFCHGFHACGERDSVAELRKVVRPTSHSCAWTRVCFAVTKDTASSQRSYACKVYGDAHAVGTREPFWLLVFYQHDCGVGPSSGQ